ncbi:MAG: ornithine carbamoyltransferase, partial [Bdellovibrionales bacterium]|nr:ornithine carbamoyltransferase [Bdellovibrionales bacterium]
LHLSRVPTAVPAALAKRSIGLFFEKPSLRTRVSCEAACVNLGAHPIQLRAEELQLFRGESPLDMARVLGGYLHLLLARVYRHDLLEEFAEASTLPIVNGLSDRFHPLQSLADLLTLVQEWGPDLTGRKVVYLGDGNNVCRSLAFACVLSGISFVAACPKRYQLEEASVSRLLEITAASGGSFSQTEDPAAAVRDADALYTDVWASMGDEAEASDRLATFAPYQLNEELFAGAKGDAIALHCLPAHRGEEISTEVLEGPRSRVFQQAHNRLPATAALFLFLLAPQVSKTLVTLERSERR